MELGRILLCKVYNIRKVLKGILQDSVVCCFARFRVDIKRFGSTSPKGEFSGILSCSLLSGLARNSAGSILSVVFQI